MKDNDNFNGSVACIGHHRYGCSHDLVAVNDDGFAEDLRYKFFTILLNSWPYPRSEKQLQQLIDVTRLLVETAVERREQGLDENN